MKSKNIFWKRGLNSIAVLAGLLWLTGCTELTCDFTYSPTEIKAGETVTFSNKSTGADDYYWTFGDNSSATNTSPVHVYKKPGVYTVTLSIVRNKVEKRTRTQHITILDTIPTLAVNSDTVYAFTPVTFYPKIYNPWSKTITYHWQMPDHAVVLAGKSLDSSAIVCYFTQVGTTEQVQMDIQMDKQAAWHLDMSIQPLHKSAPSVLFIDNNQAMEQFTYVIHNQFVYSTAAVTQSAYHRQLLAQEQDSVFQYGDSLYTRATVGKMIGQEIRGFQVDRLMAKIYAYGEGLWVCNITGECVRKLSTGRVQAIKVDGAGNRVYWATASGMYAHRLMSTISNQEAFQPMQVNQYNTISKIAIHSSSH